MDLVRILKRIKELREEIDFLVRQNEAYELYGSHSVKDQQVHAARMQRLEQIKTELDDMKAGKLHNTESGITD